MIKKYYKLFLFLILISFWIWSWWNPADLRNWFMENKIVFIAMPILFGLCFWYIRISKLSLTLISIFLILHMIGARYNYGFVPFGGILADFLGIEGNVYDKLVHFSFGFLAVYPIREFFIRAAGTKGFWNYFLPFDAILSLSGIYEIMEWITVRKIDPRAGYLFIGGSDPFDATKDIAMAGTGALLALLIVGILEKISLKGKFWDKIKKSFKRDNRDTPKEDDFIHKDIL